MYKTAKIAHPQAQRSPKHKAVIKTAKYKEKILHKQTTIYTKSHIHIPYQNNT